MQTKPTHDPFYEQLLEEHDTLHQVLAQILHAMKELSLLEGDEEGWSETLLQALELLDAYNNDKIAKPHAWFTYHLYHKAPDWIGPRISETLKIPYIIAEASYAAKQSGGPWDSGLRGEWS